MTNAEKALKKQQAQKLNNVSKKSIKGKILKASKKSALPRFCGGKSKPYSRKK